MTDPVTLKGLTFGVTTYGESDLYKLVALDPSVYPRYFFKKDEAIEIDGISYRVYLVNERSINLQRIYPPEHFQGKSWEVSQ